MWDCAYSVRFAARIIGVMGPLVLAAEKSEVVSSPPRDFWWLSNIVAKPLTVFQEILHLPEIEVGGSCDGVSQTNKGPFDFVSIDIGAITLLLSGLGVVEVALIDEETDTTGIGAVVGVHQTVVGQTGIAEVDLAEVPWLAGGGPDAIADWLPFDGAGRGGDRANGFRPVGWRGGPICKGFNENHVEQRPTRYARIWLCAQCCFSCRRFVRGRVRPPAESPNQSLGPSGKWPRNTLNNCMVRGIALDYRLLFACALRPGEKCKTATTLLPCCHKACFFAFLNGFERT